MSTVDPYDDAWPEQFEALRAAIEPALGDLEARIEHVGSTAVPGLAAKPIIDLDVVVARSGDVPAAIRRLEALGYRHQGDQGIPGREAFLAPDGAGPLHHLYLVHEEAAAFRDHVDLRDWLRTHPADAARYAARKQELAPLLLTDRQAYVDAKTELIGELLDAARRSG